MGKYQLKNALSNAVLSNYKNTKFDTTVAEIITYDNTTNKAKIKFQNPKNAGYIEIDNVPVQLGSGGVHSAGPFPGDKVWISFINNSPMQPKIVSLADEQYDTNTREKFKHSRKGSYLTICDKQEIESKDACINNWLDLNNSNSFKYINFIDKLPIDDLINDMINVSYYNTEEPGVTHPINSSTIKIKNDGVIDIFVSTNQGLRIDPNTKSINLFAINENLHLNNLNGNIDNNVNIKIENELNLNSKDVKCDTETIKITTKEFNCNSNTWTINASGPVKINSSSNVEISSNNTIDIKGNIVKLSGRLDINKYELLRIINE